MAEFFYFLGHEEFQPEVLVQHAQIAEAAGFDGVLISEHFMPWVDDKGAGGFAFSTLGAIAQATKKIKMMTAVTTPLFRYHPALVAQAAATIDRLSGGRFMLGIGTGENLNEAPLGYNFPAYAERAARLREAVAIIKPLLAGEKLDFNGAYYKTSAAKLYSPPVHGLPVLVAAGGPKSAAMAGEIADGIITSVKDPAQTTRDVLEPARSVAGSKPFMVAATRWSVYAQNDDEAWEALLPWRGLRAPDRLHATDPAHLREQADQLPREEILSKYSIVDSAGAYINTYKPLLELGANIIGIQTTSTNQEALIEMLGKEVLPKLRG